MSVIPLTVFFSLLLAGLFIALFAHEQWRRRFASTERDSLLPLADETPRLAAPPPRSTAASAAKAGLPSDALAKVGPPKPSSP